MNPQPRIWLRSLLVICAFGLEILICSLVFSFVSALLITIALLSCLWLLHLRNISRLLKWAQQPLGTPVPDGFGLWSHIFAALYQRTRMQREQREMLQAALERFREVAQSLPEGVVILTDNLLVEWMNANAEAHLGLTSTQDMGYPITNMLRDEAFVAHLGKRTFTEPLVLRPLRNPSRTLRLQLVPFREGQLLLLTRDITQMEKLETMRRDFVANVSHELKTPLTVISGFIETLSDGYGDIEAKDAQYFLGLAGEQAMRMQRLIDDLLTLSRLETGAPPPLKERVEVAALVALVRDEVKGLSSGQHKVTIDSSGPSILLGSARELRSAFSNLATNAVRYTPSGGEIKIQWHELENGGAAFSVSDTGPGIAAEHLPRLTERFYRVDSGRTRETGGTGLGLAIVKHVLERHEATLKIESTLGLGSTFSAQFPAHRTSV